VESQDPEVAVNGAAAVPSGSVGVKILSIVVEEWEPPAETEEEEERVPDETLSSDTEESIGRTKHLFCHFIS
jgi:hypothetical protein